MSVKDQDQSPTASSAVATVGPAGYVPGWMFEKLLAREGRSFSISPAAHADLQHDVALYADPHGEIKRLNERLAAWKDSHAQEVERANTAEAELRHALDQIKLKDEALSKALGNQFLP